MQKRNFGTQPLNYVPGRGRGAVGFITRSDIGPAKVDIGIEQDDDQNDYNDAKYDEWNGYSIPLFNVGDYDDEDKEADLTYNQVDKKMEDRRGNKKKLSRDAEKPTLGSQFSDLKRELAKLSYDDWNSLPDIGDYTIKRKKQERFTPITDTVIMASHQENSSQNLTEIGEARGALLSLKLDRISDNVSGQSVVDKRGRSSAFIQGYLTSLSQLPQLTETEIGDFKKARLLLKSVIQTDPKNSFGWIAAARVEELDRKIQAARSILAQGLQKAEDSEDIWIELARLESPEKAKQILHTATQILPQSIKLWLCAASKENDKKGKIAILKRALEFVPNSVDIWKELVSLSSEQEALVLLQKAVECIPKNLSLWLALAKLETYENAKVVLNKAREALPQEPIIWINAAKLEESAGADKTTITAVLRKGIRVLQKNGVKIVKEDWLNEAEIAEKCQNYFTCHAIVRALYSVADENWKLDFDHFKSRGSIYTARAIIGFAAETIRTKAIWDEYIAFEREHSKQQADSFYDQALQGSIQYCPEVDDFWIELLNRKYELQANFEEVFQKAQKSERILVTMSKLLIKQRAYEKARELLIEAVKGGTELAQMKLIKLQRLAKEDIGNVESILSKYPNSDKIWILCAEYMQSKGKTAEAKQIFENALATQASTLRLWLAYINFECKQGNYQKARPIIDRAKVKHPKSAELWISAIRLEINAGLRKPAQFLLNKALQECPRNGDLWSLAIELEPKNTRKKKSADAVTLCVDNPQVYLSTAKVFLREAKIEKAKRWLEKALYIEPRLGDAWAYLYLIEKEVLPHCVEKKPKLGYLWREAKQNNNLKYDYERILQEAAKLAQQEMARLE